MLERMRRWVLGDHVDEDDIPTCPDHRVPMVLYKEVGKPARFTDQESESYGLIYRCPVSGCDNTAVRTRIRSQIPVPGETTHRPGWAERQPKSF